MLDGWRAISILSVMSAHMLPLGPARWGLNGMAAADGMAVFFTLSGFLIVSILLRDTDITSFLVRRFARILPLAWLVLGLYFLLYRQGLDIWLANFLFYANLPPFRLVEYSSHFWSLGVEMQFYVAIACTVLVFGRRGLYLVPVAAVAVTMLRVAAGMPISVVTWYRVDEILAGGILALIIHHPASWWARSLGRLWFWPVVVLFLLSARADLAWLNYARPYFGAAMVGITILRPIRGLSPLLESRAAAYVAEISYALYIFHHFAMFTSNGAPTKFGKYIWRPAQFAATFALAHLSTFYFEKHFIHWSHNFARARKRKLRAAAA
jgi:peptidoglycan/LPS O-acetylase OafA/YrhL